MIAAKEQKSFAFIINHTEFQGNTPIEIIPHHFFQRANDEQIIKIKEKLGRFGASEWHDGIYECAYQKGVEGQNAKLTAVRLSRDQWRYWIIAFDGTNVEMHDLEIAASLLVNDLRFGFTILYFNNNGKTEEGFQWNQEFMADYSGFLMLFRPMTILDKADIVYLRQYYQLLKFVKDSHKIIYKTAERFHLLRRLPQSSVFKIIGYFSIIEALITHAPELTEPMDSLTHQMKTKMSLLSKRLQRSLNYSGFFASADGDKIWGKLYGYRSKLAHGDEADFTREFKILNSHEHALQFLNEAAKLLLLYAMQEPEFILDLKRC